MNRRLLLAALMSAGFLAGCATSNIDANYSLDAGKGKGLVVLSATHDFGPKWLGKPVGSNARMHFRIRDAATGKLVVTAHSLTEELMSVTTPFEDVWGRYYVQELPAGRYEVYSWDMTVQTGVGINSYSPKKPPPVRAFEVQAGKAVYIGNFHGNIRYGTVLIAPMPVGGHASIGNQAERDLRLVYKEFPQLQGKVEVRPVDPALIWVTE